MATPQTSSRSRHSNVSVQIQIAPKSPSEFVPRDTEEFEFLDLEDFGGVVFAAETVINDAVLSLRCLYLDK